MRKHTLTGFAAAHALAVGLLCSPGTSAGVDGNLYPDNPGPLPIWADPQCWPVWYFIDPGFPPGCRQYYCEDGREILVCFPPGPKEGEDPPQPPENNRDRIPFSR